jgi:hypothetical protein
VNECPFFGGLVCAKNGGNFCRYCSARIVVVTLLTLDTQNSKLRLQLTKRSVKCIDRAELLGLEQERGVDGEEYSYFFGWDRSGGRAAS